MPVIPAIILVAANSRNAVTMAASPDLIRRPFPVTAVALLPATVMSIAGVPPVAVQIIVRPVAPAIPAVLLPIIKIQFVVSVVVVSVRAVAVAILLMVVI